MSDTYDAYDAVVIGAGIVGSSTAFHLARRGIRTLLVDSDGVGTATAAGAGIIQSLSQSPKHPAVQALLFAGAEEYESLGGQLAECGLEEWGYAQPGAMLLAGDAEADSTLRSLVASWRGDGLDGRPGAGRVELLDADGVVDRCPVVGQVEAGAWLGEAARVEGRVLRQALQEGARRLGASIVRGSASLNEGLRVLLDGDSVSTGDVVVATGAWGSETLRAVAPEVVPFRPRRGQILHLQVSPGTAQTEPESWPSVTRIGSAHYLVGFPGDRAVIGGTIEEVGFDPRVTAGGLRELLSAASLLAPDLGDTTFLEARVGLRPIAGDELPVVGAVQSAPGLYVGNGLGHSGLHMGPAVGHRIARLITGDTADQPAEAAAVDWSAFEPERRVEAGSTSA